jgi:hypothetical protein
VVWKKGNTCRLPTPEEKAEIFVNPKINNSGIDIKKPADFSFSFYLQ